MSDLSRAYLAQARSDFQVFEFLLGAPRAAVPECHPLHYIQMATEKLAKAIMLAMEADGFDRFSHVAFSQLPYQLRRRDVARMLGWSNFKAYRQFLRRSAPVFRAIDELNPAVGTSEAAGRRDAPNVEYPWPGRVATGQPIWHVPAETRFGLFTEMRRSETAILVIQFVRLLLERFDALFGSRS